MTARATFDDARLSRLKMLFAEAITLSGDERTSFIREAVSDDGDLHDELASLLRAHDQSDSYFERLAEELIAPALSSVELVPDAEGDSTEATVSHYELIERIGGGGMGVVYKARDTRLGRLVALKFLPSHIASNPAARAQLVAEARASSRLDHPNIGVVYEIGEAEDGRQFIAMGWYEGETLRTRIRRERIASSEATAIALQLGNALEAAHRAGIVHRDVKPANVIVTTSGVAKLLDFGIAQLASDDNASPHAIAGTLAYMSPEQTLEAELDRRTDIWSLGVVLYEMLSGQRPFRGSTDSELVRAIRSADTQSLPAIPNIDSRLAAIVERCLKKNPDERFQTAEELCQALRELSNDSASIPTQPRLRATKARRAMVAAIVIVTASALIGAWFNARRNPEARHATALASPFRIAVLPLEVRADDSASVLADAVAEDLRTELARIPTVTVNSTFSSETYANSSKSQSRIAAELEARYLVRGSAAQTGSALKLQLRLIDAANNRLLATREYASDQPSGHDIVRRAAADILSLVDVPLIKPERENIVRPRFANTRAYELFLRGMHAELRGAPHTALGNPDPESIREALTYYAQARLADPSFARVRSRLATAHLEAGSLYDTAEARRNQARLEAETALRHDPWLWEAHIALSEYWTQSGNAEKAVEELEAAERDAPNNVALLFALATRLRTMNRWEDAVGMLERGLQLDPRDPNLAWLAATTYGRLKRYADARRMHNRVLEIWPHDNEVRVIKGQAFLRWKGSADTLFAELAKVPPDWDVRGMATFARYTAYRFEHRYREGLAMLDKSHASLSRDGIVYHPRSLMRAEFHHDLGEEATARRYYDLARREIIDSLASRPKNGSMRAALALAYAGLGRRQDAIREIEAAMSVTPVSASAGAGIAYMGSAVEVFCRIGELDRAFKMAELLITMNSGRDFPLPLVNRWPGFAPLRADPRYAELVRRFSTQ